MSSSKSKRNEILKTASIYAVLFIVTSMSTSALWVPEAAADVNCGTEKYFHAKGVSQDTSYTKYGTKAYSKITDTVLCGTNESNGSIVGSLVWAVRVDQQFTETGFYMGNMTSETLLSMSAPHYFWGRRYSDGSHWDYSDISSGTGYNPTVDDWIWFSVWGNADSSNHNWHVNITKPNSYTISINDLTVSYADIGTSGETAVVLEPHNAQITSTARFTTAQNSKLVSGALQWVPWGTSTDADDTPYQSNKLSTTSYCMWDDWGTSCS